MTHPALTPWWRARRSAPEGRAVEGSTDATRILDLHHASVRDLLADARAAAPDASEDRSRLLAAHGLIRDRVRPVYAMNDAQPVSRTLAKGRGSCSQRLAVLEAVARAGGIPTRVRGLLIDGAFWYPRFPRLRAIVPATVLLAWPEFRLGTDWVGASELYAPIDVLRERGPEGFTNRGGQTLFEALSVTAVDWDGEQPAPCTVPGAGDTGCGAGDLSAMVRRDLGRFDSRDELFATHGQTLCPVARVAGDTVLSRRSAA
ncbi:transglutaminase domain-containing protein [Streptomyces sp. NPDC054861]